MAGTVQAEFDVVVVGGGINGLAAAAYMARTGLRTVVIERRDQLGTHAVTEEWSYPGFRTSSHATSMWVGHSPCMMDLELEKFGLELVSGRFTRAMPFADGKAFVPDGLDVDSLYKKYLRFSKKDADTFRALFTSLSPFKPFLFQNFFFSAPGPEKWDDLMRLIAGLPRLTEDWWDMTGFEMADLLFEEEHVKTHVTSWANAVGFPPHVKIMGPLGVLLLSTSTTDQQAIGGAHQVPHALFRCIIHHGGKIIQSSEVERIVIEDGEAKGVVLGEHSAYPEKMILAKKAVISDLSPVPTFIQLVGEDHLDRSVARVIKYQYDYDWHTLFTTSYMTTSPPKWKGAAFDPDINEAWDFNVGVESVADVERTVMQLITGRVPDPINAIGSDFVLTLYDKTAAPPGHHNIQFWTDVPYNIRRLGGPEKWDEISEDVADKVTEMVDNYAPGFRATIEDRVAITPLDLYRKNPSAIKGGWAAGPSKAGQLYFDRPFLGCNAPRTPIKKLYLSNGTWPWSMSWLASGYIAANEVIKDLGIKKPDWWSHKVFEWRR